MQRRQFLTSVAALGAATPLNAAWAEARTTDPRLVVFVLMGALDGLTAIPAHGDPHYRQVRRDLALPPPGAKGGPVNLDGTFGLHPSMAPLYPLYQQRQLLVAHAIGMPYRESSHARGQRILEGGTNRLSSLRTGWLTRALGSNAKTVVVGRKVPLLIQGRTQTSLLNPHATQAMECNTDDTPRSRVSPFSKWERSLLASARIVGHQLSEPHGVRSAVFLLGGWDTHTHQADGYEHKLALLSHAILAMKRQMSEEVWRQSTLLGVTEFGRSVVPNNYGGTDHGMGSLALLAGGAVAGGRVLTDWPGLSPKRLIGGEHLRPTHDLRGLLKGVLHDHMNVSMKRLEHFVFPGSRGVAILPDLIRPRPALNPVDSTPRDDRRDARKHRRWHRKNLRKH